DCSLQLQLNREQEGGAVNIDKAQQYINAAAQVAALMANPAPISPTAILDRPGVLEEREIDGETLKKATVALFKAAVKQLVENRAVEGGKLAAFILQRVDSIRSETEKVRALLPQILAAQKQRLHDKINDLQLSLDPERLEQ